MNELARRLSRHFTSIDPEVDFRIRQGIDSNRKSFATLNIVDGEGVPVQAARVKVTLKRHAYQFGCNLFMLKQFPHEEQNAAYEETFRDVFNLAVVPFYWSDLEPVDGSPRFAADSPNIYRRPAPDLCVEYCERNGITPKGHPLLWHQFWPAWLTGSKREIEMRIVQRFEEIAARYGDRIRIWDVANEAQSPGVNPRLPDSHVDFAFEHAARLFPTSTLTYNDDCHWYDLHGDYSPVYLLVQHLMDRGRKVNALGCQYHMFDGQIEKVDTMLNPRHLFACLDQYGKLGLPINMSEISLVSRHDLGDGDEFQSLFLERLYSVWFSHAATNGLIWWNLVDGTAAYAPLGSDEGENKLRAGLVNFDFTPKKAFKTLKRLIQHEWTTNETVEYSAQAPNIFHGFHGEYDAEVTTAAGTFKTSFSLREKQSNTIRIVLP
ncbi:MAG TPA: endo-1,4-beta-xylanase [Capsulimonadaceae bacterium]|jgi:GH35 family endo-1,4-beta-xylanase